MKSTGKTILLKLRNRQVFFFVFLILLSGNVYAQTEKTDSLAFSISDTIYIASEPDYPPYCMVDEKGNPDGFAVELFKAAADAARLPIHIKIGIWNQIKQELAKGTIDALPLVGKTPEREKTFDFTIPYLSLHGAIFIRKGTPKLLSIDDLRGKELLVMKGDNAEEFLVRNNISNNITTTNTFEEAFIKLANGEGDAILTQYIIGLNLIKQLKLKTIVASDLFLPEFRQDFCFAVKKGNTKLLERLNEGLSIVIANNTYNAIHAKWFGPAIKEKLSTQDIIRIALLIFFPLLIIVAIFLIFFLRREVSRQTKQLKNEIIERKKIEEKTIEERNKAQQYLDIAGVMLVSLDIHGTVQLINPKGCEILGYSKDEILGKNWYNNFLPEDELEKVTQVKEKALQGKIDEMLYFENKIKTKSGEERLIAWRNVLLKNEDGQITGTLSSGENITDRKKDEIELIKAKEKAEESDQLKTAFLQNMSHEIRTPLNSIMGFASLLPEETDKKLINNYSTIIYKNSEQLVHIIDDIVLFSRLQNKQMPLHSKKFEFRKLLEEVKTSYNLPEYQNGAKLTIEADSNEPIIVYSDYEKVWHIYTNLISNAFKYTQQGEIKFGIKHGDKEWICFVSDTGIGIPKEETDVIFERFYRATNVNKSSIGGTGLGLSIVQELIQLLDSKIWVESEEGKGSTFYFTLPIEPS